MPGIPMVYYGDEWGMPGAGDPDNRRFMQWSGYTSNQQKLRDWIAALGKIRNEHASTRRGTRQTIGVTSDVFVYKMSATGDSVIVAMNRSDSSQQATNLPTGTYTDLVTGDSVTAPVTLPPRSALILAAQ